MAELVCFVDLLGTKESSKISEVRFIDAIQQFRDTLNAARRYEASSLRVVQFSDCAFIGTKANSDTVAFLQTLRDDLFARGYYFKCAITIGGLDPQYRGSAEKGFYSIIFGQSSVAAYLLHEQFKGLGFAVADEVAEAAKPLSSRLVRSVFLSGRDKRIDVVPYFDLKFEKPYVGDNRFGEEKSKDQLTAGTPNHAAEIRFEQYLKDFMVAATKSRSYARYYLPTLVTMIRSSDFAKLSRSDAGWSGVPLVFYKLFIEHRTRRRLAEIPRADLLYGAALSMIYGDSSADPGRERAKDWLAAFITQRSRVSQVISALPRFIISDADKSDFIERMAKVQLGQLGRGPGAPEDR